MLKNTNLTGLFKFGDKKALEKAKIDKENDTAEDEIQQTAEDRESGTESTETGNENADENPEAGKEAEIGDVMTGMGNGNENPEPNMEKEIKNPEPDMKNRIENPEPDRESGDKKQKPEKKGGIKKQKPDKKTIDKNSRGSMIKNLKIGKKLSLLIVLFVICLIGVSSFSFYSINDIKINGGLYHEIISGKDLVTDTYPPTAYIVEAYAAVQEMASTKNRSDVVTLSETLKTLHKDYEERIQYWSENLEEKDVRKELLENSYQPAQQFFKLAEEEFIPAALASNSEKTRELLGRLKPHYVMHKRAIENVNKLVTEDNKEREQLAADSIRNSIIVLSAVNLLGLLIIITIGLYIGRTISKPIRDLRSVADKLALGEVDIGVKAETKDEIGDLMRSFEAMIDNIKSQAEAGERIANGDLTAEIEPKSEKDILAISMKSIAENLRALVSETQVLTLAASEGDLNTRGNAEHFEGGFKEIVEGINSTLDGIVDPLNVALDYIEKIANGEEMEVLENNYKGKYAELINHLMMVRDSLHMLISETDRLTQAAFNGEFSYQPDITLHKGEYAKIMNSVSEALNYIVAPFRTCGEYMRQIGNGEIPEKINEDYKGEFNDIKNSINACIDGLSGLIEGRDVLERMSVNDYSEQVEGSYLGIYSEIADSVNSVSGTVRNMIRIIDNISNGDLSDLADLKLEGQRSENDSLRPSIIRLIENIENVLQEATMLSNAVIEGRLDSHSDSEQFQGAWKNLVDGMNNILVEVAKPLKDVSEVMEGISGGDLQVAVQGAYQGDFDKLAGSVNKTVGMLNVIIGEITEEISSIAGGNLNLRNIKEYEGDFASISGSLNVIIDSLNLILGDINVAAEQVTSGSRQVSDGSQSLSQGSTEQASSIEQLKSSIEDLAERTKQNAVNASQANELATSARDSAEKGDGQMKEMLKSMEDINASSVNISKIIKVIDDIAFQTNILALNAAVEAARAGQHGKGFAVVAEEVRNLAARSAEAAKSTSDLIGGSIGNVEAGIRIANETAAALREIVTGIEKAAALVGSIAEASNEQATGIAQINKGIEQVAGVVQNNSATAEQSAAASEELSGQAELLKEMVGKFKLRNAMLQGPDRHLALNSPGKY